MYGDGQQLVDFRNLTRLTLESCCGLISAVPKLGATTLPSLQSIHIRQERVDHNFLNILETFFCALPPLKALFVMLNNNTNVIKLVPVIEIHGKSLQALIIDLRDGNGNLGSPIDLAWGTQYGTAIMLHCPNLIELGIPVDWDQLQLGSCGCQAVRLWSNTATTMKNH